MVPPWMQSLLSWIVAYGYPFLFLGSLLENTVLIGLAVPGDAIAVLGGAACAAGALRLTPAFCATTAGVLLGAVVSYGIGARGGLPLIERWGGRIGLTGGRIGATQRYFAKHGAKTVFVGCFVSGMKNFAPAVAGAARMPFAKFLSYGAIATVLRTSVLVLVGYSFASHAERAIDLVHRMDAWAIGLIVVIALAWLIAAGVRRRRRAKRAGPPMGP